MNWKNRLIIISSFGLLAAISLYYYSKSVKDEDYIITKITSRFFDFNEFEVRVDSKLDINNFKIINQNSGKTIFKNGQASKGIKNDYGHCIFELYWKEKRVYEFGHFKSNNWHTNSYILEVDYENNELNLDLTIEGPDRSEMDLFFKRID